MNAAAVAHARVPAPEPEPVRPFSVQLSTDERAALVSAALAMAVSYFAAADRAELAGDLERADTLRFTALSLTQAELQIRQS